MAYGLEMASKRRLQLIEEDVAGEYNPAGNRLQMISIKGDLKPDSQFAKFRPAGYNVDAWNALIRTHSVYSGTFQGDYEQLRFLLRMLTGVAVSDETTDGVRELLHVLPDGGERDIITVTVEDGTLLSCERCPYGFLVALSLNSEIMGSEVSGNITILCRKAIATGVPMTGAVVSNDKQRIRTIVGYEGGTIAIAAKNGGVAQTITPGTDNAAAIGTKLELAHAITPGHLTATGTSVAAAGGNPAAINIEVEATGASVTHEPQLTFVSSTEGIEIKHLAAGSDGNMVIPVSVPILPQNLTVRRADELEDLADAPNLKGVRMASFELQNLAEPIWFADDENETTFSAHVDKDDQSQMFTTELATRLVNGPNPHCEDLKAKSEAQPAIPEWFDMRHKRKSAVHQFDIEAHASCSAAADIGNANNVRARRFPMGVVIANGAPIRFRLRLPA